MLALKRPDLLDGLRRLPRLAADLVLPPTCPGCGGAVGDSHALCARCWSAIRFIEPPLCPVYGTPFAYELGEGIVSAEALADPPPFRRARAAAVYGDVARRLVHQLKYHDRPAPGAGDGAWPCTAPGQRCSREMRAHRARSALSLAALAAALQPGGAACRRLVAARPACRTIPSCSSASSRRASQVGLTAAQREENVRGAFRVPDTMRARDRRRDVLLVDDVYTSGATAKAATRALLRAGAGAVDVLTFARVTT